MRIASELYLSSPAVAAGERIETVAEAVADGRIDAEVAAKYGYRQLWASDEAPVNLAVAAAGKSLAAAGIDAAGLDAVVHAWTHFQGHDFWSPAHYVAAQLGAVSAMPIGVQQMCNGGMAAVEIAATRLLADDTTEKPVLVTTGDRFAPPAFDRWGGDLGVCYGDAGTAWLVSRRPLGPSLRLLALESTAAPGLEAMHRGDLAFAAAPRAGTETLRPGDTKRQFSRSAAAVDLIAAAETAVGSVLRAVLRNCRGNEVRAVALPRLSANGLDSTYRPAVEAAVDGARMLVPGLDSGHLGAGDAAANAAELIERAEVGERYVLLSAGAGFTWSAALVEVTA